MSIRTRLAALLLYGGALCAAALACGDSGAPRRGAPSGAGPAASAAPSPDERASPPSPRRGDRHARAAAGRARPVHEVVGTLVRSEGGRIVIRPDGGREVTLRMGPRTALTAPPGGDARTALGAGAEVRASWRSGDGDPPAALSVDVQRPARDPWTDRG